MKNFLLSIFILYISLTLKAQNNSPVDFKENYKKAIKKFKASEYQNAIKAWKEASRHGIQYDKARCYVNIGVSYKRLSNYDSAFFHYNKAKNILTLLDSLRVLSNVYNNLGTLHLRTGNYEKAENNFLLSLKIKEKRKDTLKIGSTLLNLGEVQLRLKNFNKAKEYYSKSLNLRLKVKDTFGIVSCYINLGILEKKQFFYKEALTYYNQALKFCNLGFNNMENLKLRVYQNIGSLLFTQKKNDSAILYYEKALLLSKKVGDKLDIAFCKNEIARIKIQKKSFNSAKKLALEAFQTSNELNILEDMQLFSLTIFEAFEGLKDYKKANIWLKKHIKIKDSILNIDRIKNIQNLEFKYETQQKENKILKQENDLQKKEISLQESKTKTNIAFSGILIILSLGGTYILTRNKNEKNKLLAKKIEGKEEEKKSVGKELHDDIASDLISINYSIENKDPKISREILKCYDKVRNLSHQLNNRYIKDTPFANRLIEAIPEEREDQFFSLKVTPPLLKLSETYSNNFYRIIRELITNNLKYAQASETTISVTLENQKLSLDYIDNGIGISEFKKGTGFKNIEERVHALKGTLDIQNNNGLKVNINLPYKS